MESLPATFGRLAGMAGLLIGSSALLLTMQGRE